MARTRRQTLRPLLRESTSRRWGGISFVVSMGVTIGLLLAATGCTKSCAQKSPLPRSKTASAAEMLEEAPQKAVEEKRITYADAIRSGDYETAERGLKQAPAKERSEPEVKFARAIVALELNDVHGALSAIDGLEKKAPEFAPEVQAVRLRAAKMMSDVTLLAHLLSEGGEAVDVDDHLMLIEAERANGSLNEALRRSERLLAPLARDRSSRASRLKAEVRAVRAEVLEELERPKEAARELRWIALETPTLPVAENAAEKLETLDPAQRLYAAQRFERALSFSELGWPDKTAQELEAVENAPGAKPSEARRAEVLAWAVYSSRSDDQRAAELFLEASKKKGADRRKNLYYHAKSLARAGDHEKAIERYEQVAKLGGPYAEHASYQAPRLHYIDGRWDQAIKAYESYNLRYPHGGHQSAIAYELAIARLAASDYERARKSLRTLHAKERGVRERARLWHLVGVAEQGAGNEETAETIYRQVIEDRPLSASALFAAARLAAMGKDEPPLIRQAEEYPPQIPLKLELPEKIWRLSRVGLDERAEDALRAHESTIRREHGSRSGEALCRLFGLLERAQRRYQIAQWAASWENLSRAPGSGTNWQWECIYPRPYEGMVRREAAENELDPALIYAVMRQESAFRPEVVSPARAVGLMQIIPPTAARIAAELGVDYQPELMSKPGVNIRFGAYYLRRLADMFAEHPVLMAASYNAGPHAVSSWLAGGEELPLDVFVARIPYRETRNYVYRVVGNQARYTYLTGKREKISLSLELPRGVRAEEDAY